MSLEFKKIEVNSILEMLPFYAMRHNMTCDSVFLESYVWKDYYNVRYAIWENIQKLMDAAFKETGAENAAVPGGRPAGGVCGD